MNGGLMGLEQHERTTWAINDRILIFGWTIPFMLFNGLPGNKPIVTPNPLIEESHRIYNFDNEQLSVSGSTKCWTFKSMWT